MATKIQLRRDTSENWAGTNPILAQGEPGVELDTKKMKVGDGITAWNNLEYVSGGTEENSTTNMFVKIDGLSNEIGPNVAGVVSVSTDGLNWTPSTYNQQSTDWEGWEIFHLAVGNGRIVYHTYDYGADVEELRWAYNPFDKPNRTSSDVSRMGPNGEEINWMNIRYVGEKFVAVGYYEDSVQSDYYYPIAAYSTDGDNWTRINIDLSFCQTKIQDQRSVHSNDVNGLSIQDVAYGDNGWLFVMHWGPFDISGGSEFFANAFYVNDLATQLGSANYVTGIPGAYTVKYDGKGWVTWSDYDAPTGNGSILYINHSSNPRQGSWTQVDMDTVAMNLTGVNVGNITDVVAGTVNGEHWIMVGTEYHGTFATKDQGASWKFLQTGARSMNIYSVSATNPAYISSGWGYLTSTNGEKVTISGSNVPQLNGTFYTNYVNGDHGWQSYLYTDYDPNTNTFSSPLDATGWGSIVEVHITGDVAYGFNTFIASSTTNLRVGMVAEGYDGFTTYENSEITYDPNVITAIDGNKVTMKYPWHFNAGSNVNLYFRPVLYNTRGDGITSMAYGDGAFIGFSYNDGNRSYRTTDVAKWTKTTLGNSAQFGPWNINFPNSVTYGAVTTPASTLINNSETLPGLASFLTVGDTFQVSVSGGDPEWTDSALAEGHSTGVIHIDPALSQWQIGVIQDVEGFDSTNYLTISTYQDNSNWYGNHRHDSIRVQTEGYNWEFSNSEGYFNTQNLNVEGYNNGYIWTTWGEITINAPFDGYSGNGEGYAQLTWGDVINSVRVDWYGTHINTEGFTWNFGTEGYIWTTDGDGVIQSQGYWAIGDYDNYDSYTYIGATDNVAPDAYDITVVADDTYWYFNRDGTFQLPPGGDIIDDDGYSVLDKFIPQNAVSANGDYTLIITDSGKHIYKTGTGGIKIPTNAAVAFPIGTCITLVTGSTNSTTISAVDGMTTILILSKFGSDASINVPVDTYVTILKIAADKWMIQT